MPPKPFSQREVLIALIFKKGDNLDHENWRPIRLLNVDYKLCARVLAGRLLKVISELKIETFSGRRRPDWQSKPGTEAAVASFQNSSIKIAVNSGGRRLGRLPKRKMWLHIRN